MSSHAEGERKNIHPIKRGWGGGGGVVMFYTVLRRGGGWRCKRFWTRNFLIFPALPVINDWSLTL